MTLSAPAAVDLKRVELRHLRYFLALAEELLAGMEVVVSGLGTTLRQAELYGTPFASALRTVMHDLRARRLLSPASWEATFEPVRLVSGRRYPYALGWRVDRLAGQAVQVEKSLQALFEANLEALLGVRHPHRPLRRSLPALERL